MMRMRTTVGWLLLLSACSLQMGDDRPSGSGCEIAPTAQALVEGWRWRPDPDDKGLGQAWQESELSDDDWKPIVGGMAWELADAAYADYDGVAGTGLI